MIKQNLKHTYLEKETEGNKQLEKETEGNKQLEKELVKEQERINWLKEENPAGWRKNSIACYLNMIRLYEQLPDKDGKLLASWFHEIGQLYFMEDDYAAAKEYAQKALSAALPHYPADDPQLAVLYNNLGEICLRLDEHEEATGHCLRALDIQLRHQATDPAGTADTYERLGKNYVYSGHREEGMKFMEKALHIRLEAFGKVHPILLQNYGQLASTCMGMGDNASALEYTRRSLETRLMTVGEIDEGVAYEYDILALLYGLLKMNEQALSCQLKRLDILTALGDTITDADLQDCHEALAETYEMLGQDDEAMLHRQKCRELKEEVTLTWVEKEAMNTRKRIEVSAAVLQHEGKFLATQRGYGDWKDWWEFPGGKIEAGESPEQCVVREIREELNATVRVIRKLTCVEYDYPRFHLTMHCFLCRLESDKLSLCEHEDARWLSPDEFQQVKWLPADEFVLPLLTEENGATADEKPMVESV